MTEFIKTIIAGRVKNQGGVDGIADVITSLFLNQPLADHLKHALQEEVTEWVFFQIQSEITDEIH